MMAASLRISHVSRVALPEVLGHVTHAAQKNPAEIPHQALPKRRNQVVADLLLV
jgi:hypothetical protein